MKLKTLIIWVLIFAVVTVVPFLVPTGTGSSILVEPRAGVELLNNPGLANNVSGWDCGSWRFLSQSWYPSVWVFGGDEVTVSLQGNDTSFYCAEVVQHTDLNILDKQNEYVVSWRGVLHEAEVRVAGTLGVGVNLWLDVIKDGEFVEELELLVFFYQKGFNTIPVGSFKDYGYRGSYWFENIVDDPQNEDWRFFYFHPVQLRFDEAESITFSLSKCLEIVRDNWDENYGGGGGGVYDGIDYFRLTKVHSVMELFNAEGKFTTEEFSIKLVK